MEQVVLHVQRLVVGNQFSVGDDYEDREAALLCASLKKEGIRRYCSLTPESELREPYAVVVVRLKKHFGQPTGTFFARARCMPIMLGPVSITVCCVAS